MAGTQGTNGKPLAPKVATPKTSGNPGGPAAPGGSHFTGTRPAPTKGRSQGPR